MLIEKDTEMSVKPLVINLEVELKDCTWEELDSNLQFMDTRPVLSVWSLNARTKIQINLKPFSDRHCCIHIQRCCM